MWVTTGLDVEQNSGGDVDGDVWVFLSSDLRNRNSTRCQCHPRNEKRQISFEIVAIKKLNSHYFQFAPILKYVKFVDSSSLAIVGNYWLKLGKRVFIQKRLVGGQMCSRPNNLSKKSMQTGTVTPR